MKRYKEKSEFTVKSEAGNSGEKQLIVKSHCQLVKDRLFKSATIPVAQSKYQRQYLMPWERDSTINDRSTE